MDKRQIASIHLDLIAHMNDYAIFKISPRILRNIQSERYLISAPFSEFIDNSISSYLLNKNSFQEDFILKIEIFCNADKIVINDNAAGISRSDLNTKTLDFHNDTYQEKDGLNQYGVGLKQAALWLGKTFSIDTYDINSNVGSYVLFNLDNVIETYDSSGIVNMPITNGYKNQHGTTVTIMDLYQHNTSLFNKDIILSLKVQLSRIYKQYLLENRINIFLNDELIQAEIQENFLESHTFENYSVVNNESCVIDPNKNKIKWRIKDIFKETEKTHPLTNLKVKYSIQGELYILSSTNNKEYAGGFTDNQNGFKFYRKKKLIYGFTEKINHYGNNDSKGYINLYFGGEFNLSDSFTKPKIGEGLVRYEDQILGELFNDIQADITHGMYNSQNEEFRKIFSFIKDKRFRIELFKTKTICAAVPITPTEATPTSGGRTKPPKPTKPTKPVTIPDHNINNRKIEQRYHEFYFFIKFDENNNSLKFSRNGTNISISLPKEKSIPTLDDKFYLELISTYIYAYQEDSIIIDKLNKLFK